jgi:hypothetical protein
LLLAALAGGYALVGGGWLGGVPDSRPEVTTPAGPVVRLEIGGGPAGGTFNVAARAMADHLPRALPRLSPVVRPSGGSADNVALLHLAQVDLALCYAGDVWLASRGRLKGDPRRYDRVRPLGFVYGAPAQLVVPASSGPATVSRLAGRRVAVGNRGSGAALSAERFLRHLGLWSRIRVRHQGYAAAARALVDGKIDAFWVLVGYPNPAVSEAARRLPVRLLELGPLAAASEFYQAFPFYSPTTLPAGVYPGQDAPCPTFQDTTLLCTHAGADPTLVYDLMRALWSPEGLAFLHAAHPALAGMGLESGFSGAPVPLAPGAARFWQEKAKEVPVSLKPQ